jgi:ubiquinone/menaquinone biosynthesis C-methylase UbiE
MININNHPKDRYEVAALIASKGHGRFLEIGAGSGDVVLAIHENYSEIVVTELSSVQTDYLKNLFKKNSKIQVIQHDFNKDSLDFPNNYFDTSLMLAVIEHLIDPLDALKKIYRVLKPGGRLIIDTPNIAKWTYRIKLLFGRFPSTASADEGLLSYDKTPVESYDQGHLHYFTFRSLSRLCTEFVGFKKIEWFGYGSLEYSKTPFLLARIAPTLFSPICLVAYK